VVATEEGRQQFCAGVRLCVRVFVCWWQRHAQLLPCVAPVGSCVLAAWCITWWLASGVHRVVGGVVGAVERPGAGRRACVARPPSFGAAVAVLVHRSCRCVVLAGHSVHTKKGVGAGARACVCLSGVGVSSCVRAARGWRLVVTRSLAVCMQGRRSGGAATGVAAPSVICLTVGVTEQGPLLFACCAPTGPLPTQCAAILRSAPHSMTNSSHSAGFDASCTTARAARPPPANNLAVAVRAAAVMHLTPSWRMDAQSQEATQHTNNKPSLYCQRMQRHAASA
jgi:hypothetical protein